MTFELASNSVDKTYIIASHITECGLMVKDLTVKKHHHTYKTTAPCAVCAMTDGGWSRNSRSVGEKIAKQAVGLTVSGWVEAWR